MAFNYRAIEEVIAADPILKDLSDAQKQSVASILGARIGEIYRDFDTTIKNATGIDRNGAEKTYDYMERAGKSLKQQLEELTTKATGYEGEITSLKEQIAKGAGDEGLKQQITQLQSDNSNLKQSYTQLKQQYDEQQTQHKAELFNMRVSGELQAAFDRISVKKDANPAVVDMVKANAKAAIMGMNPTYYADAQGKETLIFRDPQGATMNNPDNSMNPFTAEELLRREMDKYGILATAGKGGAGGGGGKGGNPNPNLDFIDLSGVRSQDEAVGIIDNFLRGKGYQVGSYEYQQKMTEYFKENKILELPLQAENNQ